MSQTHDTQTTVDESEQTQFVLVSGFLGAGKTTSMRAIGERLTQEGYTVGMITNDQASGLVDTTILDDTDGRVEEIAGGCFCCNFGDLMDAAQSILDEGVDVLLCEPVGSCTDLVATVVNPLQSMYADEFAVGPLTAILDPSRVRSYLDEGEAALPEEVRYIFRLQVEEADLIVLNKTDTLDDAETERLVSELSDRVGDRPVFPVSAKQGTGVPQWMSLLIDGFDADDSFQFDGEVGGDGRALTDIDYDTYAEGEAKLGWVNLTISLSGPFEATAFRDRLMDEIRPRVREEEIEVAHLKYTISAAGDLCHANLTSTTERPGFGGTDLGRVDAGELVFNARAVGDPEEIQTVGIEAIEATADEVGADVTIEEVRAFRPEYPEPVHRMDDESSTTGSAADRLGEFEESIERIRDESE